MRAQLDLGRIYVVSRLGRVGFLSYAIVDVWRRRAREEDEMADENEKKRGGLITPEHLEHIALFPLPNAVFFPNTMLPLHIFEPRYREMTQEAIEDEIPIAIMRLTEPRSVNALGLPAFHEVGGAGFVLHHQRLPDGRYNILLEGVSRVRVLEEIDSDRPYRVGRAELVPESYAHPEQVQALLATLRGCVVGLQNQYSRLSETLAKTMNNVQDPSALADTIASLIVSDPDSRQALLADPVVDNRLDTIISRLTDLLALSSSEPSGSWMN